MQSKRSSWLEAALNTLISVVVAFILGQVLWPLLGIQMSAAQNLVQVLFFTVVSMIRGYWVRRFFNHLHVTGRLK